MPLTIRNSKELAKDMRPYTGNSGIYCSILPDAISKASIAAWAAAHDLPPVDVEDLHCTIMYSPDVAAKGVIRDRSWLSTYAVSLDLFGPESDTLVLLLHKVPALAARFDKWLALGAVPTYPDYKPHVTLATGFSCTPERLKELRKSIKRRPLMLRFGQEWIEDIKP